jgi:hypothetical protein
MMANPPTSQNLNKKTLGLPYPPTSIKCSDKVSGAENGPGRPGSRRAWEIAVLAREYIVRHRRLATRFGSALLSFSSSSFLCLPPPLPLLLSLLRGFYRVHFCRFWWLGAVRIILLLFFVFFFGPLLRFLELSSSVGDFLRSSTVDSLRSRSAVASVSCAVWVHLEFRLLLKRFLLRLSKWSSLRRCRVCGFESGVCFFFFFVVWGRLNLLVLVRFKLWSWSGRSFF